MRKKSYFLPAALTLLLASAGSAHATITVYKTQALYLAAIANPGIDNFDDLDPADTLSTPQDRSAGAYSYRVSTGPANQFFPAGERGVDVWLSTATNTDTITFDRFSSNVRGFGGFFFGTDINGALTSASATLNMSVTDQDGTISRPLVDPTATTFMGFVTTGVFSDVRLWVGAQGFGVNGVWPTVNDLTLGTVAVAPPVPEPETYALMLGGLALLGAAARRLKP
jgi:PEP-CTERM motif